MSQGKLPNFERLHREGAYGPCRTFKPTKSNVIWTSIATGKRMEKHGIIDWMVLSDDGQERLLTTGNQRRTEALWNIATAAGKSVQLINWWATWPAEHVNGEMVSNHFTKARKTRIDESTYPATLYDELEPLVAFGDDRVHEEMRAAGIPVYSDELAESAFRPSENFRGRFQASVGLFAEDMLVEESCQPPHGDPRTKGSLWCDLPECGYFFALPVAFHRCPPSQAGVQAPQPG